MLGDSFCVQKSKLVKCKLILKAFSLLSSARRKLIEQVLGFFNFIFTILPLARSFIRVWYDQLRSHISDSSRVIFDRSPLGPLRDMLFSKICFYLAFGDSQASFALFCGCNSFAGCWHFWQRMLFWVPAFYSVF